MSRQSQPHFFVCLSLGRLTWRGGNFRDDLIKEPLETLRVNRVVCLNPSRRHNSLSPDLPHSRTKWPSPRAVVGFQRSSSHPSCPEMTRVSLIIQIDFLQFRCSASCANIYVGEFTSQTQDTVVIVKFTILILSRLVCVARRRKWPQFPR